VTSSESPSSPSFPRGRAARRLWLLEEGTVHLNHGAFGATPRAVLAAQDRIRVQAERQPLRFFTVEGPAALRAAAGELAIFLGAEADDIGLVENATGGVGSVLASLPLSDGDEIVATDHTYPAVRNALAFLARRRGVRLVVAPVPYPITGPGAVVDAVRGAITPRTRLVVLDHITSQTGLIFPVEDVAAICRPQGIALLIDGAHAPGMLELDLPSTSADWYVGNCHKWLCCAKGTAFVWRNPDSSHRETAIHPPVISHNLDLPFPAEHDWVGTRDLSSWLALPAALAFHHKLGGAELRRDNRSLARAGASILADAWGGEPSAPWSMFGSLAVIPMPGAASEFSIAAANAESARIRDRHRIEVAVTGFAGRLWCRVSAQAYNEISDYERLAAALDPMRVGTTAP
jgi:isopenicillin-N epimerase